MNQSYKNLFQDSLGGPARANLRIEVANRVIDIRSAPALFAVFPTKVDAEGSHTAAVAAGNRRDIAEMLATAITFMMQNGLLEDVNALLASVGLPTLEEKKRDVPKEDSILPDAADFEQYLQSLGIRFSTDDN